jgi:hypothetical protein
VGAFLFDPVMTYLFWGKVLETLGAFFLAYVGAWIAVHQILTGHELEAYRDIRDGDLKKLGTALNAIFKFRRRQFGFFEAICVGIGTALVFLGCLVYLIGLWMEQR